MLRRVDIDDRLPLRRVRARRLVGLYAVTPDVADTSFRVAGVEAALAGGASAIQYRSKSVDAALKRMQAEALARVHAARGGLFIVNDDAALALAVGADGVHLGVDDGSIAAAREILGPERLIGVSCYDRFELAEWTHSNVPEWEEPHGSSSPIPYERVFKYLGKGQHALELAERVAAEQLPLFR